jgi:AraC-like DNA-binding protein
MSEQIVQHQKLVYEEDVPFHFYELKGDGIGVWCTEALDNGIRDKGTLFNHWHEDLEVCYTFLGRAHHYINGEDIEDTPGRVVVTNEGFIHSIVPDDAQKFISDGSVLVVMIQPEFVREVFPDYSHLYFTNYKEQADPKVHELFGRIRTYMRETKFCDYAHLYGKGLVLELLYLLCQEGVTERNLVDNVNVQKNIERMKGIISYIEQHYRECLRQSQVAEKFYFSSVYFSRYFKQCTGMTFTDYVTRYRVEQAKKEMLSTQHNLLDIALNNGFTDERRLILAFKKYYDVTPCQYKKRCLSQ